MVSTVARGGTKRECNVAIAAAETQRFNAAVDVVTVEANRNRDARPVRPLDDSSAIFEHFEKPEYERLAAKRALALAGQEGARVGDNRTPLVITLEYSIRQRLD